MKLFALIVGPLGVNCTVVYGDAEPEALIIDPGDEAQRIAAMIDEKHLRPVGILLTHAHVDHIGAVGPLAKRFGIPVQLHPADHTLYFSPNNALPPWVQAAEDLPPPGTVSRKIAGLEWRMIETPGHTPGSVGYYFPNAGILFSGDTLFAGGVGRTDLPGGDWLQLEQSIRERLYTLPPRTEVLSGHGSPTTIEREMKTNPFVRANRLPEAPDPTRNTRP